MLLVGKTGANGKKFPPLGDILDIEETLKLVRNRRGPIHRCARRMELGRGVAEELRQDLVTRVSEVAVKTNELLWGNLIRLLVQDCSPEALGLLLIAEPPPCNVLTIDGSNLATILVAWLTSP